MRSALPLAALGAAFVLSACSTHGGALNPARFNSPDFGASVRGNIAVQSIPADPAAVNSPVEADGARQSLAQTRYRTDRVKQPPDPNTSSVTGTNTGTSSSSGGGGSVPGTPQ